MDHELVVHSQYARYNSTNPRRLDELADAILAMGGATGGGLADAIPDTSLGFRRLAKRRLAKLADAIPDTSSSGK